MPFPLGRRNSIARKAILNGHRPKVASSMASNLLLIGSKYPSALKILFATSLLSWVSMVVLFLSGLTSDENAETAISPFSARSKHTRQLRHKVNLIDNAGKQMRAIWYLPTKQYKPKKEEQTHQKYTRDALDSSEPYVQKKNADEPLPSSKSMCAFAAEKYLDATDMMGEDDDSLDTYYAVDDDAIRGKREEKLDKRDGMCVTPAFYRLNRPTCNEVHSTLGGYQWLTGGDYVRRRHRSRYLGSGNYRDVFLLERNLPSTPDEVIFKIMKKLPSNDGSRVLEERAAYDPEEVYNNFELYDDMRKDSMVMELLTSSPRIANIYQFCALASVIEYVPGNIEDYVMPTGGEKEGTDDDLTLVNDHIKPLEKLEMALEVAKGIATMHGYHNGVIANVDVQLGQFCRGKDGLIKVLDFNRAEVIMYDEDRDEYCPFSNGVPPDGSLRAPEEIIDAPLNEKIDVYSLGNVFYTLLTGLLVNRNYSVKKAHWRITHGKTEEIDVDYFESRSPAEMALVEVIQWCWTFEVEERPSIFQVVQFLEDKMENYLADNEQEWQKSLKERRRQNRNH